MNKRNSTFQVEHSIVYQAKSQAHTQLVQTRPTSQVENLVPALLDEIEISISAAWGTDTTEFREFCVHDTLQRVTGQVAERVFIGLH